MNLHDYLSVGGNQRPPRLALPGGIVTVPAAVPLGIEFVVARFKDAAAHAARKAYLTTRDGMTTLGGGLLLNTGGLDLWKALHGDSITAYDATNSHLAVGDSSTAAAATQTALVNEIGRQNMDASFPLVPGESAGGVTAADREWILRSTFGGTDANGNWREFLVDKAATPSGSPFDRFVSSQGTKASGQVWELTVTILGA